jgi:hypothetical protein
MLYEYRPKRRTHKAEAMLYEYRPKRRTHKVEAMLYEYRPKRRSELTLNMPRAWRASPGVFIGPWVYESGALPQSLKKSTLAHLFRPSFRWRVLGPQPLRRRRLPPTKCCGSGPVFSFTLPSLFEYNSKSKKTYFSVRISDPKIVYYQ